MTNSPILRSKAAADKLCVCLTTLWKLSQEPGFPRKIKLTSHAVGYYEHELDAWLKARQEGGEL